jgi:peptide alpha-N-acetyltransferase
MSQIGLALDLNHLCLMTHNITYRQYDGESDLPHIMALVQNELSEPYVIYTFRYFLHQWYVV